MVSDMGRMSSKGGMDPSTLSQSQSMWSTASGENHAEPSFRTFPDWSRMKRWKGSMDPSITPRRRIWTSCPTPSGSMSLRITSTTRLFMPHQ